MVCLLQYISELKSRNSTFTLPEYLFFDTSIRTAVQMFYLDEETAIDQKDTNQSIGCSEPMIQSVD